jgi:hypothetical protein
MALILPSYYKKDNANFDPGPWYVIMSSCDHLGPEISQNIKPLYRDARREPCVLYFLNQVSKYYDKGYRILGDGVIGENNKITTLKPAHLLKNKDLNIVTLKYDARPNEVIILNRKQYIIFGLYSKRMVEAGKFVKPSE